MTQAQHITPDPISAADPAAIDAWIAQDQRHHLISFMQAVNDLPLDIVVDAIRTACNRGFGVWMEPPTGNPAKSIRPATHMVEIAIFGVIGSGLTTLEAAQSWRLAARRVLESEDAA